MAEVRPFTPPTITTVLDEKRTAKPLPYWLVNVPQSERPTKCPKFLCDIPARHVKTLSTPDEQFHRPDWVHVKEIVQSNRMDLFRRLPSTLRKYLERMASIKEEYESVVHFIIKERVCWGNDLSDIQPRGKPFEYDEDIRILYNDWPYGVDTDIIHLVVWVKFAFEEDPITGHITENTRAAIESYVQHKFGQIPSDKLIWFRNWAAIKSVPGLEHFHVMLYQPDMEFVKEITCGDVPMIERK